MLIAQNRCFNAQSGIEKFEFKSKINQDIIALITKTINTTAAYELIRTNAFRIVFGESSLNKNR